MTHHVHTPERRRTARILLKGTVIMLAPEQTQRGRIANIGPGGLLATTAVTAASRMLGRTADLELRLDGQESEWLRLVGRIARIENTAIAIAFEKVPTAFIQLIEEMASASNLASRVLSLVLVDEVPESRSQMAEAFRAAGCNVTDVSTSLEAIVRLGELAFEPNVIVIANSVAADTSEQLRRFVEREHPRAKLIAIGENIDAPDGIFHWLSSTNPNDDLASRVRHVLTNQRRRL